MISSNYNKEVRPRKNTLVGPSVTIPGEATSLKEIAEQFVQGLDIAHLQKFGHYDADDTDFNDLILSSKFQDLEEVMTLANEYEGWIEKLENAKKIAAEKKVKEKLDPPAPDPTPEPIPDPE